MDAFLLVLRVYNFPHGLYIIPEATAARQEKTDGSIIAVASFSKTW